MKKVTLIQRNHDEKAHRVIEQTDAPDGAIRLTLDDKLKQGFGFKYFLQEDQTTTEVELLRVSLTRPRSVVVKKTTCQAAEQLDTQASTAGASTDQCGFRPV